MADRNIDDPSIVQPTELSSATRVYGVDDVSNTATDERITLPVLAEHISPNKPIWNLDAGGGVTAYNDLGAPSGFTVGTNDGVVVEYTNAAPDPLGVGLLTPAFDFDGTTKVIRYNFSAVTGTPSLGVGIVNGASTEATVAAALGTNDTSNVIAFITANLAFQVLATVNSVSYPAAPAFGGITTPYDNTYYLVFSGARTSATIRMYNGTTLLSTVSGIDFTPWPTLRITAVAIAASTAGTTTIDTAGTGFTAVPADPFNSGGIPFPANKARKEYIVNTSVSRVVSGITLNDDDRVWFNETGDGFRAVSAPAAEVPVTSDNVQNESTVTGGNVTAALDSLNTRVPARTLIVTSTGQDNPEAGIYRTFVSAYESIPVNPDYNTEILIRPLSDPSQTIIFALGNSAAYDFTGRRVSVRGERYKGYNGTTNGLAVISFEPTATVSSWGRMSYLDIRFRARTSQATLIDNNTVNIEFGDHVRIEGISTGSTPDTTAPLSVTGSSGRLRMFFGHNCVIAAGNGNSNRGQLVTQSQDTNVDIFAGDNFVADQVAFRTHTISGTQPSTTIVANVSARLISGAATGLVNPDNIFSLTSTSFLDQELIQSYDNTDNSLTIPLGQRLRELYGDTSYWICNPLLADGVSLFRNLQEIMDAAIARATLAAGSNIAAKERYGHIRIRGLSPVAIGQQNQNIDTDAFDITPAILAGYTISERLVIKTISWEGHRWQVGDITNWANIGHTFKSATLVVNNSALSPVRWLPSTSLNVPPVFEDCDISVTNGSAIFDFTLDGASGAEIVVRGNTRFRQDTESSPNIGRFGIFNGDTVNIDVQGNCYIGPEMMATTTPNTGNGTVAAAMNGGSIYVDPDQQSTFPNLFVSRTLSSPQGLDSYVHVLPGASAATGVPAVVDGLYLDSVPLLTAIAASVTLDSATQRAGASPVDTTTAAVTVTLNTTLRDGVHEFLDIVGNFGTNSFTIAAGAGVTLVGTAVFSTDGLAVKAYKSGNTVLLKSS